MDNLLHYKDNLPHYNGIVNSFSAKDKSSLKRGNQIGKQRPYSPNNDLGNNLVHYVAQTDREIMIERVWIFAFRDKGDDSLI